MVQTQLSLTNIGFSGRICSQQNNSLESFVQVRSKIHTRRSQASSDSTIQQRLKVCHRLQKWQQTRIIRIRSISLVVCREKMGSQAESHFCIATKPHTHTKTEKRQSTTERESGESTSEDKETVTTKGPSALYFVSTELSKCFLF